MIVWVTRDEAGNGPLSTALRARGLEVVLEPVVERRLVADPAGLVAGLTAEDWLVLTSPYAIEAVAPTAAAKVPRVAVVGEASAALAERFGLRVAMVGKDGHGDTLFGELRVKVPSGVVCYPRSGRARQPEAWGEVQLRSPVLYETVARGFDRERVRLAVIAAVAAPSQVAAVVGVDIPMASIGRTTSAAIRAQGKPVAVEAAYPTFEKLAAAIAGYLRGQH